MASEDPANMFADMKKKKKKPKVAFTEEPSIAEPDPVLSKTPIDDPSLGPATEHERIHNNSAASAPVPAADDAADAANMFGDLKKKKKKKEVTIDAEADATPADAAAEALDFSDLKKKKKKKEATEIDDAPAEDAAPLDDFSDLKRKKKKKDIPMDLEAPAEDAGALDDFSDIKKKKKKKDIPMDLEGVDGAPAEGGEDFSDMKKKKKKKNFAMEEFEKEIGDAPEPAKPKKSKKVVEESDEEGGDEADEDGAGAGFDDDMFDEEELGDNPFANAGGRGDADEPWLASDRDYTYDELLSRFFRLLHSQNPSLASSSSKRYTLAPPSIHRDGNKKSVFANIGDICKRMRRDPAHVISFLLVEMGTTGSVDGSGRLVIKGKFQQKQIENILRRYIVEYVTCKTCKSPETLLTKETRISFITCESCGSRQSVSTIKAGFQAQVGKRKKQQV